MTSITRLWQWLRKPRADSFALTGANENVNRHFYPQMRESAVCRRPLWARKSLQFIEAHYANAFYLHCGTDKPMRPRRFTFRYQKESRALSAALLSKIGGLAPIVRANSMPPEQWFRCRQPRSVVHHTAPLQQKAQPLWHIRCLPIPGHPAVWPIEELRRRSR